ncbi:hypothetical protein TrRE_jg13159, partial [Triparma retinervis]
MAMKDKGEGGRNNRINKIFKNIQARVLLIIRFLRYVPPKLTPIQKVIYVLCKFSPFLLVFDLLKSFIISRSSPPPLALVGVPFSTFMTHLSTSAIKSGVGISRTSGTLRYATSQARHITVVPPGAHGEMVKKLLDKGVAFGVMAPTPAEKMAKKLALLVPVLYMGLVYRLYKRMTGGGGGGDTGQVLGGSLVPSVTFDDVVGMDRERLEVMEILDSISDAGRYAALGARTPKGVLMSGPPGTGKTLLAKALAGTGNVPMISASGSDFMEVFVGRGAQRVRELFKKAKKLGRCVIFIDEIDAVGKRRGMGLGGRGNDEQEQTLNALLSAMDGVTGAEGVVVLAATNRAEVLDEALTRPGRFDRIVRVGLPGREGRVGIFRLHGGRLKG